MQRGVQCGVLLRAVLSPMLRVLGRVADQIHQRQDRAGRDRRVAEQYIGDDDRIAERLIVEVQAVIAWAGFTPSSFMVAWALGVLDA